MPHGERQVRWMRNLRRNLSTVYFKPFVKTEEILDEWGNPTGSFKPVYGELQSARLCISPSRGSTSDDTFGTTLDYDRAMTTADIDCPIDENTVLWLDGAETTEPHNYIVKKRAPWKNSVAYAIKRVTVSD